MNELIQQNIDISKKENDNGQKENYKRVDEAKLGEFFSNIKKLPKEKRDEFLEFCKINNLNPFLEEVYVVEYKNYDKNGNIVSVDYKIVVSYHVLVERVLRSGLCEYYEIPEIKPYSNPLRPNQNDAILEIKVKRKNFSKETIFVSYFNSLKRDTKMWRESPEQMFRKSAFAEMARYYFGDVIKAYILEEMINDDAKIIDVKSIEPKQIEIKQEVKQIQEPKQEIKQTENANNKNDVHEIPDQIQGNGNETIDKRFYREAFKLYESSIDDWESVFNSKFGHNLRAEQVEKILNYVKKSKGVA